MSKQTIKNLKLDLDIDGLNADTIPYDVGVSIKQHVDGLSANNTVLNGLVDPTIEGIDGDFYINTNTWDIFGPKSSGVWGTGTSLIGPTGADGTDGTDGADGATGPQGPQGPQGPAGADGQDGADGTNGLPAHAWVQFQVSGTVITILDSFNITSVTRVSTGLYQVEFPSVGNTSFMAVGNGANIDSGQPHTFIEISDYRTNSRVRFETRDTGSSPNLGDEIPYACVIIYN